MSSPSRTHPRNASVKYKAGQLIHDGQRLERLLDEIVRELAIADSAPSAPPNEASRP
jgi:hypothetical protein